MTEAGGQHAMAGANRGTVASLLESWRHAARGVAFAGRDFAGIHFAWGSWEDDQELAQRLYSPDCERWTPWGRRSFCVPLPAPILAWERRFAIDY